MRACQKTLFLLLLMVGFFLAAQSPVYAACTVTATDPAGNPVPINLPRFYTSSMLGGEHQFTPAGLTISGNSFSFDTDFCAVGFPCQPGQILHILTTANGYSPDTGIDINTCQNLTFTPVGGFFCNAGDGTCHQDTDNSHISNDYPDQATCEGHCIVGGFCLVNNECIPASQAPDCPAANKYDNLDNCNHATTQQTNPVVQTICNTDPTNPACKPSTTNGQPCPVANGVGIGTAIGCIPTDLNQFIPAVLKYGYALGGGIALLLMIFGAFQMLISGGNPEAVKKGREQFVAAAMGLLFILLSTVLLRIIGFDILNIPGF